MEGRAGEGGERQGLKDTRGKERQRKGQALDTAERAETSWSARAEQDGGDRWVQERKETS